MKKVLGTKTWSLWRLYQAFTSKEITLPIWQRRKVWLKPKKDKWIGDIREIAKNGGGDIAGLMVLFSAVGQQGQFLNDGWQRLSTLIDWADKMLQSKGKKKSMGREDLITLLSKVNIWVQECSYSTMEEAFKDFFRLQLGTPCTPAELGQGILSTQLDWKVWEPKFNHLHEVVERVLDKLNVKSKDKQPSSPDEAPALSRHARDDFALLHRLATGNAKLDNYHVSSKAITRDDLTSYFGRAEDGKPKKESKLPMEERLVNLVGDNGTDKFDAIVIRLDSLLTRKSQIYKRLWDEKFSADMQPQAVNVRWWFAVAVYAELAGISDDILEKFTEKYITVTKGDSRFTPKGDVKNVTVGLGDLSKLKLWATKLECPEINPH